MILAFHEYQVRAADTAGPANDAIQRILPDAEGEVPVVKEDGKTIVSWQQKIRVLLRLQYAVDGLANEGGEVLGKVKKLIRDKDGVIDEEFMRSMVHELGDVLWYLADTCTVLSISLADVAQANLNKLRDRKQRGVLQGDGDNR